MISTWQAPTGDGKHSEELLVAFDQGRERRILVVPALFDEANKMRRLTLQLMRALDSRGIDSFLPDLPGQNESLNDLAQQTFAGWRKALTDACDMMGATEFVTVRAGAALVPEGSAGTFYAPLSPKKQLRSMLRARTIAAREAGIEETIETLNARGRKDGLMLAGWQIGAPMFTEMAGADIATPGNYSEIDQKALGGRGLWLRAEPDEDAEQAEALAALLAGEETEQ